MKQWPQALFKALGTCTSTLPELRARSRAQPNPRPAANVARRRPPRKTVARNHGPSTLHPPQPYWPLPPSAAGLTCTCRRTCRPAYTMNAGPCGAAGRAAEGATTPRASAADMSPWTPGRLLSATGCTLPPPSRHRNTHGFNIKGTDAVTARRPQPLWKVCPKPPPAAPAENA